MHRRPLGGKDGWSAPVRLEQPARAASTGRLGCLQPEVNHGEFLVRPGPGRHRRSAAAAVLPGGDRRRRRQQGVHARRQGLDRPGSLLGCHGGRTRPSRDRRGRDEGDRCTGGGQCPVGDPPRRDPPRRGAAGPHSRRPGPAGLPRPRGQRCQLHDRVGRRQTAGTQPGPRFSRFVPWRFRLGPGRVRRVSPGRSASRRHRPGALSRSEGGSGWRHQPRGGRGRTPDRHDRGRHRRADHERRRHDRARRRLPGGSRASLRRARRLVALRRGQGRPRANRIAARVRDRRHRPGHRHLRQIAGWGGCPCRRPSVPPGCWTTRPHPRC